MKILIEESVLRQAADFISDQRWAKEHDQILYALNNAIKQMEKQEPVAWLPSAEWTPCVKLPVTVHVRKQREGETHVSTREGITPIKPDDLIMRGVSGEEYPIGREIFEQTYRIGYHPAPAVPEDEIEKLREQLATVTAERDELVETLKYFSEYGYGRDICIAALAKLGADKTGEK